MILKIKYDDQFFSWLSRYFIAGFLNIIAGTGIGYFFSQNIEISFVAAYLGSVLALLPVNAALHSAITLKAGLRRLPRTASAFIFANVAAMFVVQLCEERSMSYVFAHALSCPIYVVVHIFIIRV